ncbi:unnamed protein product, partial [Ilex paraguariensis]
EESCPNPLEQKRLSQYTQVTKAPRSAKESLLNAQAPPAHPPHASAPLSHADDPPM